MSTLVRVTEVGLRDGLQNQPQPVNTTGKLALANALISAGVRHIEAVSFVHPKAVPQMADAAEVTAACRSLAAAIKALTTWPWCPI
jgi:hydroxymethylglutaryl-CoA lyase